MNIIINILPHPSSACISDNKILQSSGIDFRRVLLQFLYKPKMKKRIETVRKSQIMTSCNVTKAVFPEDKTQHQSLVERLWQPELDHFSLISSSLYDFIRVHFHSNDSLICPWVAKLQGGSWLAVEIKMRSVQYVIVQSPKKQQKLFKITCKMLRQNSKAFSNDQKKLLDVFYSKRCF